jgi:hypothetical protein
VNKDSGAVTVTGCLMKESDYRRAHNLGSGALNGVGLGDEFVVVDATMSPAAAPISANSSASAAKPAPGPTTAAACSEQGTGAAYRVTGKGEDNLKAYVGRRMEITGTMKHADDDASVSPSANASASASAADTSKLPPEVELGTFREAAMTTASAAPMSVEPATPAAPAPAPPAAAADNTPRTPAPSNSFASDNTNRPNLPQTASPAPLVALIGLLSLAAAWVLSYLPRRA